MKSNKNSLKNLTIGESAVIKEIKGSGKLRQQFLDMGLISNTVVSVVKFAPMGDPVELKLRRYVLSLRLSEVEQNHSRKNFGRKFRARARNYDIKFA